MRWQQRSLHKEFEAKSASRFQGMLSAIMHPEQWRTLKTADFMEHYTTWLGDVAAYETQKNKVIEGDVKVAVIMKYAPDEVKMALRQSAPTIGADPSQQHPSFAITPGLRTHTFM